MNAAPAQAPTGDPPYPADTRAKGWRFELDYERIEQSDTWSFAAEVPMAQHSLLMQWLAAWKEIPCGSLPNDEAAIRAKCRIPPAVWSKVRDVLMRGWTLASDGRLYHAMITGRVLSMLATKERDKTRKAEYRARMDAERARSSSVVPQLSHGTDADGDRTLPESTACDDTGTGTGTGTSTSSLPSVEKKARKRAALFDASSIELPGWLDRDLWADWVADRRERNKPITQRAAAQQLAALTEYRNVGQSPERVIRHAIASGNQGLYPPPKVTTVNGASGETAWQRSQRERMHELTGGLVSRKPPGTTTAEVSNALPIAVRVG